MRSNWSIKNDVLLIALNGFSTQSDFEQILKSMKIEDSICPEYITENGVTTAEEIDIEKFHATWLSGIILGIESFFDHKENITNLINYIEGTQLPSGAFYPERVPWSTARVLLGLSACGKTLDNSHSVKEAVNWLLRDRKDQGGCINGIWESGTGTWNSTLEVTSMVLLALNSVGFDFSDSRIRSAISRWRHRNSSIT